MNANVNFFNQTNYPELLKNPLTEIKEIENFLIKEGYSIQAKENEIRINKGSKNGCKSFIEYKKDIINADFKIQEVDVNNNYIIITKSLTNKI